MCILVQHTQRNDNLIASLIPNRSNKNGNGKHLPRPIRHIVRRLLRGQFLAGRGHDLTTFRHRIARIYGTRGLQIPTHGAITLQVTDLSPHGIVHQQRNRSTTHSLRNINNRPPTIATPLRRIRVSRAIVSLVIISSHSQRPVNHPCLALTVSIFAHYILNVIIALRTPSTISINLYLIRITYSGHP